MTKALDDILRQPDELCALVERLLADESASVAAAAGVLAPGVPIYLVGIGSSFNAALAIATRFQSAAIPAFACDASELLHFAELPTGSNVVLLSRSGRSVEIVRLLEKLERARCRTVAITNTPDSPLGDAASHTIDLAAPFDHNVSFTMYTGLALAGGLLAAHMTGEPLRALGDALVDALSANARRMPDWRAALVGSRWIDPASHYYFVARGPSVASCNEARLLFEETAKAPAGALTTGGFRHGPQECIRPDVHVGVWLDPTVLNAEDRRLIDDLRAEGVPVMCIGTRLEGMDTELALELEPMPPGWQFLADIIPVQLVAEHLAGVRGEDPDEFKHCPYVVEQEVGLRGAPASAAASS